MTPGALSGGSRELHADGVQVLEEHYRHVFTNHYGSGAPDSIGIVLPLRVQGEGMFNGRRWRDGTICLWNANREFNAIVAPADVICVMVDRALLVEHIAHTEHMDLEAELQRASIAFELSGAGALAQRLGELVAAGFGGQWEAGTSRAQQLIRQEVLETLAPIVVEHLGASRKRDIRARHLTNVQRAREVALAHVDMPLQIQDLCRELRISRRALQDSFRAVLGIGPVWYLRTLRLDGARRSLLAGHSVRDVTEMWGFWHWSRFSADYRRLFGELPSATLKRSIISPASTTRIQMSDF